jgi:hypothetical protein
MGSKFTAGKTRRSAIAAIKNQFLVLTLLGLKHLRMLSTEVVKSKYLIGSGGEQPLEEMGKEWCKSIAVPQL